MQVSQTGSAGASSQSVTPDRVQSDKETFLKLLITQLKNQDPLDPVQDKEFIAQLAQFSSLETLQSINEKLDGSASSSQVTQAVSLVGRNVTMLDPELGEPIQGQVEYVRILGDTEPMLRIRDSEYPISWLIAVNQ